MRLRFSLLLFCSIFLIQIPAMAQSVAVGMGVVKPGDDKFWITGSYRMSLKENLFLEPEIGYWERSDFLESCIDGIGCIQRDILLRDVNVAVHALFSVPKDRFRLSFGGGVGAHFLKNEFSTTFDTPSRPLPDLERSDSTVQPGLHFLGEFDVRVSKNLSVFLVSRNEFIRKFNDNFKLYGGVRWEF